jgi:hypothetical protein
MSLVTLCLIDILLRANAEEDVNDLSGKLSLWRGCKEETARNDGMARLMDSTILVAGRSRQYARHSHTPYVYINTTI